MQPVTCAEQELLRSPSCVCNGTRRGFPFACIAPGTLAGTYAAAPALTRQRSSQQPCATAAASPWLVEWIELSGLRQLHKAGPDYGAQMCADDTGRERLRLLSTQGTTSPRKTKLCRRLGGMVPPAQLSPELPKTITKTQGPNPWTLDSSATV